MIPPSHGPLHTCPGSGYTLLPQPYLKWGMAVERRMKNGRTKSFFIFGNFVCRDVREEDGGSKLDVDILEMCREFFWEDGGGGVGGEVEEELFPHDGNIGMLPWLRWDVVSYLGWGFILIHRVLVEN